MLLIDARNISKSYHESGHLMVLKGVDLAVNKGEMISIAGPSGAGKSTLLHILGTLDRPDSGELVFDNENLFELNDKKLATFRNLNMGFVFQFHHLLPEFSALENICMPSWIAGKDDRETVNQAMLIAERLGLSQRLSHKPSALSGGEQQRVSVARALINKPKVIFADEPSGNLDEANARDLHRLFVELKKDFGYTFVIVTHNNELAAMADRKLVMKDGVFVN